MVSDVLAVLGRGYVLCHTQLQECYVECFDDIQTMAV